jgi:hypothetical protein
MVSEDLLPPSSGYRLEVARCFEIFVPTTRLHGLTTLKKTVIFIFVAAEMYFDD